MIDLFAPHEFMAVSSTNPVLTNLFSVMFPQTKPHL